MMEMKRLLRAVVQFKASDLHIQAGSPPSLRIDGEIKPLEMPPFSAEETDTLVREIADDDVLEQIRTNRSADFSYVDPELARFRVNVFYERGML